MLRAGFNGLVNYNENDYSLHSTDDLWEWINDKKNNQRVEINKIRLSECSPWYYEENEGVIRNKGNSFFKVSGIRQVKDEDIIASQPIILQPEIGFLGIICCLINGVWHFLIQAKVEPGNIDYVQLSPTLQATKSNFTRKHGGKEPGYLEYFINMNPDNIFVDQIQSEQSSRFLGKRNRNVILKSDTIINELPSHRWMTLAQIKHFMQVDNLINMDTRTVLSCIPYIYDDEIEGYSKAFINSLNEVSHETMIEIYSKINNTKMFDECKTELVPLFELADWHMDELAFRHNESYPFEVVFCNVEIEGREVAKWNQPLFAANGSALFALITTVEDGVLKVLVKLTPEIGCFDKVEIGPTLLREAGSSSELDEIGRYIYKCLDEKKNINVDVMLSEEGGRFYQEQNRNIILSVNKEELGKVDSKYIWSDVATLNSLAQINNCLNIQLRNLLTLLYFDNMGTE